MDPPVPYGGTYSMFALTTFSAASTNISTGTGGMTVRCAVRIMRRAFSSGRNSTTFPSFWQKAFMPSKHSCP